MMIKGSGVAQTDALSRERVLDDWAEREIGVGNLVWCFGGVFRSGAGFASGTEDRSNASRNFSARSSLLKRTLIVMMPPSSAAVSTYTGRLSLRSSHSRIA